MKKIFHVGKNLANVPYLFCSALRDAGVPVELYIGKISNRSEEPLSKQAWVHSYRSAADRIRHLADISRADCLHTYAGSSMYLQFLGKPFVIYATGSDLHELPYQKGSHGMLMRRSLKLALRVLFSNVHLLPDVEKLGLSGKAMFIPQPIDAAQFGKNAAEIGGEKPLFVCPSRIDFAVKGQDIVLKAFSEYKKGGGRGTLLMFDWGPDAKRAKKESAGIKGLEFRKPIGREDLLGLYAAADVVIDQFKLKALGLTSLEGMASGKPVVVCANRELHRRTYGEEPPVLDACSWEEILEAMQNEKKWAATGKKAREWIKKYHDPRKIAKELISIYTELGWMG